MKSFLRPSLFLSLALMIFAFVMAACSTPVDEGGGSEADDGRPTVNSFIATPRNLPSGGGEVTLSWDVLDATTITINQGVGEVGSSGSTTVTVDTTTLFTLTASNSQGTTTRNATVLVGSGGGGEAEGDAPTIMSFSADPATLPLGGGSVLLSWVVEGADSLTIDQGIGNVGSVSNTTVSVTATTTFTLTATNEAGSTTAETIVTVEDTAEESATYGGVVVMDHTPDTANPATNLGGFFFELEPPFTEDLLTNPTADRTDVCEIFTDSTVAPGPFLPSPDTTLTTLDVGAELTFNSGGSVYAAVPKVTLDTLTAYSLALPLDSAPPDDLTITIPGGNGFPGLSSVTVPDAEPFTISASNDFSAITPTTIFSWMPAASDALDALVKLEIVQADDTDTPESEFVGFRCTLADDGSFTLPVTTQSELSIAGFESGDLTGASRESYSVERNGVAVLLVITEVNDPEAEVDRVRPVSLP